MNDIFALFDACCEAYDNPNFKPRGGVTFCNQAVQFISDRVGYKGFQSTMNANAMIGHMAGNKEWIPVEMKNAQKLANTGTLVIACHQDNPHGHVVVVRPGREVQSGKWGVSVPKAVNIGSENSIAKGLNYIFPDIPQFYALEI